jgi:hypothetical protein
MNRRLYKELESLILQQNSKPLIENDYLIYFDDCDMNKVYAIIKGNSDSVYKHKFIRLNFDIPKEYPFVPPLVTFVNFDGVRIHPTLYEDGRTCSTILNTWPSDNEKWSSSFGIETVLLTFQSFLDNNPYTHEPGGRDNTTYTDYVLHQTWQTCLLRYLYDDYIPELFINYMNTYLLLNIEDIFKDLNELNNKYPEGYYSTPCFYIYEYKINYNNIIYLLEQYYHETLDIEDTKIIPYQNSCEFNCNICFDTTNETTSENKCISIECNHQFHIYCIKRHVLYNGQKCPICRSDTSLDEWLINPLTNKKIKIDNVTFKKLMKANKL